MAETIKVLIKEPGKTAEVREVRNELKAFQELVGGYIEPIQFDHHSVLLCNEEGKLQGLPVNFPLWNDVIVGTAVIVGTDGDQFTDVSLETIAVFSRVLEMEA